MAPISVLISSGGRVNLLKSCLQSLLTQDYSQFEVYLALPETRLAEIDQELQKFFFSRGKTFYSNCHIIPTSNLNVATGRNWALKNCPGDILLFLDEDVSLPDTDYLKRLATYHQRLPKIELLGGYYLTPDDCSAAGKAYNQVARMWIEKHRNPHAVGTYNDLLVAGALSLKLTRETRKILFPIKDSFGGEEEVYLSQHWKAGHSSRLIDGLSLKHHAQHNLITFFSRAWLHGENKRGALKLTPRDIQYALTYSGHGTERLMVYSYLACTRLSNLYNVGLKNLQRVIPLR